MSVMKYFDVERGGGGVGGMGIWIDEVADCKGQDNSNKCILHR